MPACVQPSVHVADTTPALSAASAPLSRPHERVGLHEALTMLSTLLGTMVLVSSLFWG
ncbi:hypothetical protein [Cupriavidus pampae]|uniref:Uncharacterized protein n=1 Tax=Cupriavidus pampae TaxID=659251 RepID=A0ABM8X684_9BURK|nr:hypothetical protein [Cupriavidus pampae]CAG9175466.1 hypothetical protein LMG32289_03323 [Cupriavidus pampae]